MAGTAKSVTRSHAPSCPTLQTEYARLENGRFVYRIHRSPMCEYMINFIHKLKHLPEKYMMNSVLENFTILQVRGWCAERGDRASLESSLPSLGSLLSPCSLPPCPRRWSQVGTRRRPCWSLLLSLKSPPASMGHSIMCTSLSKTSMPLTSTGCEMDILHTPACLLAWVWVGGLTHPWASGWDPGCLPGSSTHAPCHCSALYWREEGSMG